MAIQYFVEWLSRIGSVSIIIQTDDEQQLTVERLIQVDSELIKLQLIDSDPSTLYIPLPTPVRQMPNIESSYTTKNNTVSIRLPVVSGGAQDRSTNQLMSISSNYKWSAKYLKALETSYQLICSTCGCTIMNSSNISVISEMPSELWAEMMDFWHCHKPHDHDTASSTRFTSLKPLPNGLITASYYFAFNIDDKLMENLEKKDNRIHCNGCDVLVGEFDKSSGLQKIFKWSVKLMHGLTEEEYQPYTFVYNNLLDNVNNNATRIVEFANDDDTKRVLIWVFNVGIDFVVSGSRIFKNGLKVYYTTESDNIKLERDARGEMELVIVSDIVLSRTVDHLESFNAKLPKSIKTMGQNWKLGLIAND
jgi:hypothetical protein